MDNKMELTFNEKYKELLDTTTNKTSLGALKKTLLSLTEIKKDSYKVSLYNQLVDASNRNITIQRIVDNSRLGGVLNNDYYLVNFKGAIAEIKKASFWRDIAYRFSVIPINNIKFDIIFKTDKVKLIDNGTDYELELNWDKTNNYEDINGGLVCIKFDNGTKTLFKMTKVEFDKLKSYSPSKGNKYSPWETWPIQMCENKMLRKAIRDIVSFDPDKMFNAGYNFIDDEVAIKEEQVNGENIVVEDNAKTREVYDKIALENSKKPSTKPTIEIQLEVFRKIIEKYGLDIQEINEENFRLYLPTLKIYKDEIEQMIKEAK